MPWTNKLYFASSEGGTQKSKEPILAFQRSLCRAHSRQSPQGWNQPWVAQQSTSYQSPSVAKARLAKWVQGFSTEQPMERRNICFQWTGPLEDHSVSVRSQQQDALVLLVVSKPTHLGSTWLGNVVPGGSSYHSKPGLSPNQWSPHLDCVSPANWSRVTSRARRVFNCLP